MMAVSEVPGRREFFKGTVQPSASFQLQLFLVPHSWAGSLSGMPCGVRIHRQTRIKGFEVEQSRFPQGHKGDENKAECQNS